MRNAGLDASDFDISKKLGLITKVFYDSGRSGKQQLKNQDIQV